MKYYETVIIGGGQAGLATSYYLSQQSIENIVLEKSSQAANNWRNGTWDSFTLVTPNFTFRMPGYKHDNERNGFMPRKKVIEFFENFINENNLPVSFDTAVNSVERIDNGAFLVQTNNITYKSKNVVIATGLFQQPKIPKCSSEISADILQIHSSNYRNPASLPSGAVLVVGSGQSGSQIAEELHSSGRKVFLCVGTAGRAPRRYRGLDIIEWLEMLGFFNLTPEELPSGMGKFDGIPHLTGANGGHTINLHQFARNGIILLGHLKNAKDTKIFLEADLYENLRTVDGFELKVRNMIDNYIQFNKLDLPGEEIQELKDGYNQKIIEELDLKKENINTVIWAGGYKFDYSIVKLPVCDPDGFPIQRGGVTDYSGLYFVGMPWMPSEKSGFLIGVAESAQHIASKIAESGKTRVSAYKSSAQLF